MAQVFDTGDSVFFVGGRGDKNGDPTPGGCTKEWWDAKVASAGALAALQALTNSSGGSFMYKVGQNVDSSLKTIASSPPGDLDYGDCEVGMLAYLSGTGLNTGVYEITEVGSDFLIFGNAGADFTSTESGTIEIHVGGAFSDMDTAIGAGSYLDASTYNVQVYDNKDEPAVGGIVLGCSGSTSHNSHLDYIGFYVAPGDMDFGGTYFGGALVALQAAHGWTMLVPAALWVGKDCNGDTTDGLLSLGAVQNVCFRNLRIHNMGGSGCLLDAGNSQGFSFGNCRFEGVYRFSKNYGYDMWFDDCYFYDITSSSNHSFFGGGITNCVFDNSAVGSSPQSATYAPMQGCLFYGGDYGFNVSRNLIIDSLFYGQAISCLRRSVISGGGVKNCWFSPASGDSGHVFLTSGGSWSPLSDHIGTYGADGASVADPWETSAGICDPDINNILTTTDPDFINSADGNFRMRRQLSLLGVADLFGTRRPIGPEAILRRTSLGGLSVGSPITGAF